MGSAEYGRVSLNVSQGQRGGGALSRFTQTMLSVIYFEVLRMHYARYDFFYYDDDDDNESDRITAVPTGSLESTHLCMYHAAALHV